MNMNSYEQGFIDKCAEAGIDPDQLLKQAGLGSMLSAGADDAYRYSKHSLQSLSEKIRSYFSTIAKPGLNHWADTTAMGSDFRNAYRGLREWYHPTTADPRTQALLHRLGTTKGLAKILGYRGTLKSITKELTDASLAEQRALKKSIVMAGLLPPTAMGVASIGATMAAPALYDAVKT